MGTDLNKDEGVEIDVQPHPHPDRFDLSFDPVSRAVTVRRVDQATGWGQDLALVLREGGESRLVRVGPSPSNVAVVSSDAEDASEVSFRVGRPSEASMFPRHRKAYVALATIPSRASSPQFIENLRWLSEGQTLRPERVFVTVAHRYKRLGGSSIPSDALDRIRSVDRVEVIEAEDFGPASKYLGPLTQRAGELEGNLLAVVDDDRMYSRNLLRHFSIGFNIFGGMRFAAGDGLAYFRPEYERMDDCSVRFEVRRNNHGFAGFFGFCLRVDGMDDLVGFHREMLNRVEGAFYHDDGMIRSYVAHKGEDMLMLEHRGCDRISVEPPDALCRTTPFDRNAVEAEMMSVVAEMAAGRGGAG